MLSCSSNQVLLTLVRFKNLWTLVHSGLFDSWFTSMSLIKKLLLVNKSVHVIGMYKYNSKLVVEGKEVSIKQLRKQGTKAKRSRSMNLYYHQYIAEIDGVKVSVFITKRGTNGA